MQYEPSCNALRGQGGRGHVRGQAGGSPLDTLHLETPRFSGSYLPPLYSPKCLEEGRHGTHLPGIIVPKSYSHRGSLVSAEENKAIIRRLFEEAANDHNLDVLDEPV